jgi:predicted negative regulator of RcsB-dependent stress response
MSNSKSELLIDHYDNLLLGKGSPEVAQLIGDDTEIAGEWRHLNIAVDAIRDAALHEQVMAIRKRWMAQVSAGAEMHISGTPVRTIYRNVMKIAACILVMAGGAAIYKYSTTSSAGIYQEYASSYELTASRGATVSDPIDQAFDNKNWARVLAIFNTTKDKTTRSFFLAGIADLQLQRYDAAVGQFRQVMAENMRSGTDYFQDEAEYYLAMSLLAQNRADQAMPLLKKIKADPYHLYHQKVASMSFIDLRIAAFKEHK